MSEIMNGMEGGDAISLEQKYIRLLEQKIVDLERSFEARHQHLEEAIHRFYIAPTEPKRSSPPSLFLDDKSTEVNEGDRKEDEGIPKPKNAANGVDADNEKEDGKENDNRRFRLLDRRWNEKVGMYEEVPSRISPVKKAPKPSYDYAFTWLRNFDEDRRYKTTKVTITSPHLKSLIKNTCRASSSASFTTLVPQFDTLIWDWDALQDAADEEVKSEDEDKATARKDLGLLLNQVKSSAELQDYFEKRKEWMEDKEIKYEHLWTLFPPGEMVVSQVVFDHIQAFIARDYGYLSVPSRNSSSRAYFQLNCWSYDWNGETFNRVPGSLKIEQYAGAKAIKTLKFYPIKYHADKEGNPGEAKLRGELKTRGEKFRDYCIRQKGSQLFYCDGPIMSKQVRLGDIIASNSDQSDTASITEPEIADTGKGGWSKPSKVKGNVIVDHKSYFLYNEAVHGDMGTFELSGDRYECTCSECMKSRSLKDMMKFDYDHVRPHKDFEDDQFIICPARVLGYVMGAKVWAQMPVVCIHEIKRKIKGDAFETLILDPQAKRLIMGLVGNHEKKKLSADGEGGIAQEDWIEGKGRGLVILLHGPPGVGKTSTAESVAQATGKPLFSVSVSDIGMKPDRVENKMAQIFDLAAKWEAVLLFDEADVFLESRGTDKGDLNRNSLVTVFLRILEYYDGILILTTNRIRTFDIAVQSRVHLAVRYNELSTEQLRELFLKFVRQNPHEMDNVRRIEEWIKEEFDEEIDGRQIRNVVSSARAMAKSDKSSAGKVKLDHIRSVLKMTVQFQKHLRDQRVAARRDQVVDSK